MRSSGSIVSDDGARTGVWQGKPTSELKAATVKLLGSVGSRYVNECSISEMLQKIPVSVVEALYTSEVSDADLASVREVACLSPAQLSGLLECFKAWSEADVSDISLWVVLAEQGVAYRTLVLYLHAMITAQEENSFMCAHIFFALLSTAGNANVFNSIVLRAAMNLIKMWARAQREAQLHSTRKTENAQGEEAGEQHPFAEEEEEDFAARSGWLLDAHLGERVSEMLSSCLTMLRLVGLERNPEAFAHAVEALIDVSRVQPGAAASANAYGCLGAMMLPLHGSATTSFNIILKHLVASVLMSFTLMMASSVPKSSVVVRDESIAFIRAAAEEKKELWGSVLHFVQHLCVRAPEKAEYKRRMVASVVEICCWFPHLTSQLSSFLLRLSRNTKAGFRTVAVDIASGLLCQSELLSQVCDPLANGAGSAADSSEEKKDAMEVDEEGDASTPQVLSTAVVPLRSDPEQARDLLSILLSRCSDKAPSVRAKALTSLAHALELGAQNPLIKRHFQDLLRCTAEPLHVEQQTHKQNSQCIPQNLSHMCPCLLIRKWTGSPKATPYGTPSDPLNCSVSSLSALAQTPGPQSSLNDSFQSDNIFNSPAAKGSNENGARHITAIIRIRSADPRPLVRKAAIEALEGVFSMAFEPANAGTGSLPWTPEDLQVFYDGCMDAAVSIRKTAMGSLTRLLSAYPDDPDLNNVWLGAVFPLTKDPELTVQDEAFKNIDKLILQRVKDATKKSDANALIWKILGGLDDDMNHFLQVAVGTMIRRSLFPVALIKDMNKQLPTATHKGYWTLMVELSARVPAKIDMDALLQSWNACCGKKKIHGLSKEESQTHLKQVLQCLGNLSQRLPQAEAAKIVKYLFKCLTDFDTDCPPSVAKSMIRTLKLADDCVKQKVGGSETPWENVLLSKCTSGLESLVFRTGKMPTDDDSLVRYLFYLGEIALLTDLELPSMARTLVQTLISKEVSASLVKSSNLTSAIPAAASGDIIVRPGVRAHAFVALGKLCLKNETLAKQMMPTMAGELQDGESAVVQNNVLVIMCDLARTFTSVVDNYVDNLTYCLRNSNEMIRRQALMILSQLLQEDYLKWKGAMFFRFLASIIDPSSAVRILGEQSFRSIILCKAPNKFYMHFVESMFYLNNCTKHPVYNQFHSKQDADFACSSHRKRMVVYKFLLSFMSDVQKFKTSAKLCQDVLGSIVEGALPVDEDTFDLIKDTLIILASQAIKIKNGRTADEENDLVDINMTEQDKRAADVKVKFLSKLMKKTTLETIVPILVELKRLFESQQSPLLRYLMFYLKELLADYRSELEDVLVSDRQLMTELQYDLRQFAMQQQVSAQQQELRRLSITPSAKGPRTPFGASPAPTCTPARRKSRAGGRGRSTPASAKVPVPVFATPRLSSSKKKSVLKTPGPSPVVQPMASLADDDGENTDTTNVSFSSLSALQTPSKASKADVILPTPSKDDPASTPSKWKVDIKQIQEEASDAPAAAGKKRTRAHD